MKQARWFGVAALVLALAACGGGSNGDTDAPPAGLAKLSQAAAAPNAVPQAKLILAPRAAPAQPTPVRMAAAASATSSADAFFDWAERTQFDLFPGPQTSQSLPPFVYHYYPTNQLYLAVSGDQVYALGPITNNQVVTLGKLSDYACLVSLASCAPPPVPTPSATLNVPNSGKVPWNLVTPITVALKDSVGNLVSGTLTCATTNAVALTVAADCSSATGHRLGQQTITVTGGGVSASANVKVIAQAQPLGTQGAAGSSNMVVTPAGRVLAWGQNHDGVLGQGKTYSQLATLSLPTPVKDQSGLGELTGIVAVSAGNGASALALTEDGEIWSWGDRSTLGRTVSNSDAPLPGKVRNAADNGSLAHIAAVSIGDDNALALADDGTVYSWGDYAGQEGGSSSKAVPGQVRGVGGVGVLSNIVAVSAGWNWSAALTADGKVVTWGFNSSARTGQGVTTSTVDVPGYVLRDSDGAPISDIVAISAGYNFGLALTSSGQVYGWGDNSYGQLGQNTSGNVHARAVLVKGVDGGGQLGRIKMVAAGGWHALALDQDGKVWSWGFATSGQLGDGPNRPTGNQWLLPRAVVSQLGTGQLADIDAIAAGYEISLALGNGGNLLIWGNGYSSKLGQGGTSSSDLTVPTTVKDTTGTGTLSLAPASVWPNLTRRAR